MIRRRCGWPIATARTVCSSRASGRSRRHRPPGRQLVAGRPARVLVRRRRPVRRERGRDGPAPDRRADASTDRPRLVARWHADRLYRPAARRSLFTDVQLGDHRRRRYRHGGHPGRRRLGDRQREPQLVARRAVVPRAHGRAGRRDRHRHLDRAARRRRRLVPPVHRRWPDLDFHPSWSNSGTQFSFIRGRRQRPREAHPDGRRRRWLERPSGLHGRGRVRGTVLVAGRPVHPGRPAGRRRRRPDVPAHPGRRLARRRDPAPGGASKGTCQMQRVAP